MLKVIRAVMIIALLLGAYFAYEAKYSKCDCNPCLCDPCFCPLEMPNKNKEKYKDEIFNYDSSPLD